MFNPRCLMSEWLKLAVMAVCSRKLAIESTEACATQNLHLSFPVLEGLRNTEICAFCFKRGSGLMRIESTKACANKRFSELPGFEKSQGYAPLHSTRYDCADSGSDAQWPRWSGYGRTNTGKLEIDSHCKGENLCRQGSRATT